MISGAPPRLKRLICEWAGIPSDCARYRELPSPELPTDRVSSRSDSGPFALGLRCFEISVAISSKKASSKEGNVDTTFAAIVIVVSGIVLADGFAATCRCGLGRRLPSIAGAAGAAIGI